VCCALKKTSQVGAAAHGAREHNARRVGARAPRASAQCSPMPLPAVAVKRQRAILSATVT
jgi:hypothetical protein